MRNLITIVFVSILVGCSASAPGPVNVTEIECRLNSDCDVGSYCDPFANLCGWDCRADAECELGMFCDATNGRCLREGPLPLPPDMSAVLEIVPGPTEDLTVRGGTADAEFVRVTLRNHSGRSIEAPSVLTTFDPLTGFSLEGVLGEVKLRNERNRMIVMGPIDLTGALIRLENVFSDALVIPPGEEMILAVRADVHATNRTEFDLVIGTPSGVLLSGLRYLDTGEAVPMDHVANNLSIVRHINVLPEGAVTLPDPGTVSVFMDNSGRHVSLDASDAAAPGAAASVFHITAANNTDESVRLSDLRIRVSSDDGLGWSEGGTVILSTIDVYDGRDGTWLFAPPGTSGCVVGGCTFIYDSIRLAPGEIAQLDVRMRVTAPGRRLFVGVGEGFTGPGGVSDVGGIFHRIANGAGDVLPPESIVGNQPGYLYLDTR